MRRAGPEATRIRVRGLPIAVANRPQPGLHLWPERTSNLLWRGMALTLSGAGQRRLPKRGCS